MKTKSIIFCFVFAVCVNIHTANAQVNVQDSLALVDLYNSTDGPHWYNHTNWLTSSPVDTWFGIFDVTDTRVTNIFLGYNNLKGIIPSSLGNLVNLQYLYLDDNQLSDIIPSSLGNHLKNLIQLDLSNNQLSGIIPSSLGNLINIRSLYLSNNQLRSSIPSSIGNLVNLSDLYLDNNRLSGAIPYSIGNIVNLSVLHLDNNRLNSSIPSSFGNFANLWFLFLNNNRLSGGIPSSLSNLKHNLYLDLSHNYFTFDAMEFVAQTFTNVIYSKQKRIPIHQNGNALSVAAGGTLSNNIYKWYRFRKEGDTIIIKGDSVFHPTQSGKYLVRVKNSVATQLTLYSDSIVYTAPDEPVSASAENALQQQDKTNLFRVYPNPAKDIIYVQTNGNTSFSLLNQSGKILLTANINGKGSINISGIAAGLYYLKNNSTEAVQKVVIAR